MSDKRGDLKSELMTEAEGIIDELVAWTADTPAPNLTQIEDIVLKLRQRLSERMALRLLKAQGACGRYLGRVARVRAGDALQGS